MLKLLKYLHLVGVRAKDDIIEQERIMLLNDICILNIGMIAFFMLLGFFTHLLELSLIAFLGCLCFSIILWLQSKRYFAVARWFTILTIVPYITYVLILFGLKSDVNHSFILITIVVLILFNHWKSRLILTTYNLLCFIIGLWYLDNYSSLHGNRIEYWYGGIIFLSVLLTAIFIVDKFSSLSFNAESRVKNLLNDYKKSNIQLEEKQIHFTKQNVTLENTNKELEQFMYVASHDLKAPLRSISSFTSLIKQKLKNHPDENIHEYLEFTTKSTTQMQNLIDDILVFSRIGQRIEIESVDLNKTLESIQYELSDILKKKNASIKSDDLPTINTDKELIRLLFLNLIDNAIRYNESEIPEVIIDYHFANQTHQFIFKDNGIGIATEHSERIFEIFKRLHTQVIYQGSGVGLAVCQKIVNLFSGKIQIDSSQINIGTTFIVEIKE